MKQLIVGSLLCLVLAACRTDKPPVIEICIGDGFGAADCIDRDGNKVYRSPSELQNYWMSPQQDMAAFSSWCYKVNKEVIESEMQKKIE